MTTGVRFSGRRGMRGATVAALAVLATVTLRAGGQVRLLVPDESPSGPFYARIERGVVLEDDGWVAIPFYRDPNCVRVSFNLLNFFDLANIPAIFDCPLTVHGFELWNDPTSDPAPKASKLQGNGLVPVWFVSTEDFNAALPGLTLSELLAMPSLMPGEATAFEETLHPLGGARRSLLEIVASGDLPDGRTFDLVAVEAAGELHFVRIEFR